MNLPLVSIIIPTYKKYDTLSRAINSVLKQTYKNIEIIIVDDNDPKSKYRINTEKVMESFKDNQNIIYIKHTKNINGSAARNTGFKHSKGEYIALLDDDDEFLPQKIEKQIECLEKRKDYGACYCKYNAYKDGKFIGTSAENREGFVWKEELKRNFWHGASSSIVVRRSVYQSINGFDENFIRNQDIEFMLRLTKKYKLAFVNIIGYNYYMFHKKQIKTFDEITDNYINTFKSEINSLSIKEQIEVYKMLDLQRFRMRISNEHNIYRAFQLIKEKKLSIFDVIKYSFYLIKRGITKKSYGYKI